MYKIQIKLGPTSFSLQTIDGTPGTTERTDGFLVERLLSDSLRFCHTRLWTKILTYFFACDVS